MADPVAAAMRGIRQPEGKILQIRESCGENLVDVLQIRIEFDKFLRRLRRLIGQQLEGGAVQGFVFRECLCQERPHRLVTFDAERLVHFREQRQIFGFVFGCIDHEHGAVVEQHHAVLTDGIELAERVFQPIGFIIGIHLPSAPGFAQKIGIQVTILADEFYHSFLQT